VKILIAGSEAVPYVKTGGLGDVLGALPRALARQKQSVIVFLPFYRQIDQRKFRLKYSNIRFQIPIGHKNEWVEIWEQTGSSNPKIYFVRSDKYFFRQGLYGETPFTAYMDNHKRFILFCLSLFPAAKALRFKPDIMHGHDWQTGLIPAYLKYVFHHDPFFRRTASVFTIHNMAYQGNFAPDTIQLTGLPHSLYKMDGLEFYEHLSFLKSGLVYSDWLTTVSPAYAQEIQSEYKYGLGMEGILKLKRKRLTGILNGLDREVWNPKKDVFIPSPYDIHSLHKRADCKKDLQQFVHLRASAKVPVLSFIGRLDSHKGIEVLLGVANEILKENIQLIVLGRGNPEFQIQLHKLRLKYPQKLFVENAFAEPLAHKIYAGADLFLMPSQFEPCGLGQMIAMRYGCIPVVTPTGGLKDTVLPYTHPGTGYGFVAANKSSWSFYSAVIEALMLFRKRSEWVNLQKRAMSAKFTWEKSVEGYLQVFKSALKVKNEG